VLGGVEVEDVLHLGDEAGVVALGDAPGPLQPGLERVFF
jgi:hypothetical protein